VEALGDITIRKGIWMLAPGIVWKIRVPRAEAQKEPSE
jgi:hypothetical protein